MSAVAVAVGGAAVIGAAVSSNNASKAASAQDDAAKLANVAQQNQLTSQQKLSDPYTRIGANELSNLSGEMPDLTRKFSMEDFHQDPGYQFQLAQGTQAMDRSAAARGMLNSAGTMEGINAYGQGMANTDYQQALTNFTNNQNQRYNMYAGMAGMGNTANGQMAQVGMNAANNMGNNMMGAANASAAASMAGSNAISSGANSLANGYMNYNMMNKFSPQGSPSAPPMSTAVAPSNAMAGGDSSLISNIG